MAFKKGISQIGFSRKTSISEIIRLAYDAGFDGIEFKTNIDSEIRFNSTREDIRKIYLMLRNNNLEAASVSNGANWSYPISSPDESIRRKGIEYAKKTVEIAYWLETDAILLVPGQVTPEIRYDKAWKNSLKAVVEIGKYALDYNVIIAIEEVWNKLIFTPLEMERFINEANREIGQEIIGVYFDVGNIMPFGYPEHWILYLGEKIKRIHIKDFKGDSPGLIYSIFPPYGSVNWTKVMDALKRIGYKGYLTAEIPVIDIAKETVVKYISSLLTDLIKSCE